MYAPMYAYERCEGLLVGAAAHSSNASHRLQLAANARTCALNNGTPDAVAALWRYAALHWQCKDSDAAATGVNAAVFDLLREELEACTQTQVVPYDGLDLVAPPAAFRTRAHEAATVVHDMREGRTFGSSPLLRCIPLALCPELRSDAELVAAARIEVRSTHPHELAQWAGAGLVVLCRRLIAVTPSRLTLEASVKRAADAVAESIPVASSMWAGLTSRLHELPAPSAAPYTLQAAIFHVASTASYNAAIASAERHSAAYSDVPSLVGALAGALYGSDAVSAAPSTHCAPLPPYLKEHLRFSARALFGLAQSSAARALMAALPPPARRAGSDEAEPVFSRRRTVSETGATPRAPPRAFRHRAGSEAAASR